MNHEEITNFLSKLVEFDTSINPGKNIFPNSDCANFIHEHAISKGFEVLTPDECFYKDDPNNPLYPVLLCKKGQEKGNTVLFLGHIDVVPVSPAELPEWTNPPFNPKIEGDLLLGRGSGDMKGGVTAFFAAFDDLDISKGNLVIALSGDEEIGGLDTVPQMIEVLKDHDLVPDYVINAEGSGSPFIVTQRRGGTQISYTFDLEYDRIKGRSKSSKYYSSLGDGSQGLHSMSYLSGSSIHAMITAAVATQDKPISHVQSSSSKNNAVPKEVSIAYVEEDPSLSEEIMFSKGITKMMHALASISSLHYPIVRSKYGPSICPNLIEINNDTQQGKLTFDIRSMLSSLDSHKQIAEMISDHFASFGLNTDYELELTIDPVNIPPDHELAELTNKIAVKYGYVPSGIGEKLGGASDTRFFTTLGIPGIEIGPIATNAHGMNETVNINSIKQLKLIYRELFGSLI